MKKALDKNKKQSNTEKNFSAEKLSKLKELQLEQAREIPESYLLEHQDVFGFLDLLIKSKKVSFNESQGLKLFIKKLLEANIVNGVSPISVGRSISIDRVVQTCKANKLEYELHPKFSGVPVKFKTDTLKFTAVFFKSGKINIVGLQNDSPDHVNLVVQELKKYELGFFGQEIMQNATKRLANRVYAVSIPKLINLKKLDLFNQLGRWKDIKYNSQSFPGVVIKFPEYKSKALLFKTGSIIFTGIVSNMCKKQILKYLLVDLVEYLTLLNNTTSIS